jgi:regulator of PEP synthase PpsR (kinase-PPPase family)
MKYLWVTCLVLGFATATEAKADSGIQVEANAEVQFLKNYDAKIKALNNYTVTFDDGSRVKGQKPVAHKAQSQDRLQVTLVSR